MTIHRPDNRLPRCRLAAATAAIATVALAGPLLLAGCATTQPQSTARSTAVLPGLGAEACPVERFAPGPNGAMPLASVERRLPDRDDLAANDLPDGDRPADAASRTDDGGEPHAH